MLRIPPLVFLTIFLLMACSDIVWGHNLFITEFMAVRSIDILDDDRDRNDFIEIYNNGPSDVPMGGYFLSDDCANPLKWSFPAGITLQSGNFFLVWASEKDRTNPRCALHTNFRLDGDGECVLLSAAVVSPRFFAVRDAPGRTLAGRP